MASTDKMSGLSAFAIASTIFLFDSNVVNANSYAAALLPDQMTIETTLDVSAGDPKTYTGTYREITTENQVAQVANIFRSYYATSSELLAMRRSCDCSGEVLTFAQLYSRIKSEINLSCCPRFDAATVDLSGGTGFAAGDLLQLVGGSPWIRPMLLRVALTTPSGSIIAVDLICNALYVDQPTTPYTVQRLDGGVIATQPTVAITWNNVPTPRIYSVYSANPLDRQAMQPQNNLCCPEPSRDWDRVARSQGERIEALRWCDLSCNSGPRSASEQTVLQRKTATKNVPEKSKMQEQTGPCCVDGGRNSALTGKQFIPSPRELLAAQQACVCPCNSRTAPPARTAGAATRQRRVVAANQCCPYATVTSVSGSLTVGVFYTLVGGTPLDKPTLFKGTTIFYAGKYKQKPTAPYSVVPVDGGSPTVVTLIWSDDVCPPAPNY